jgi:Domain of unknown function (DUF4954)
MTMSAFHPDFSTCATERSIQIEWSNRLFQLATQDTPIKVDLPVSSTVHDDCNHNVQITTTASFLPCTLRPLYPIEIDTLETKCRCKCKDWTKIHLLHQNHDDENNNSIVDDDLSQQLSVLVSDTRLDGIVVLICVPSENKFTETTTERSCTSLLDTMIPIGIHGCTVISNSMIHINSAKVHNCTLISHTYIDANSIVMNCPYIAMSSPDDTTGSAVSSNSIVEYLSVSVGAESGGGRPLHLLPESTMIHVSEQIVQSTTTNMPRKETDPTKEAIFNIIGPYCIVRDTPTLYKIHLHSNASIIAATSVANVLLFPASKICNACTVQNAILQWNSTITDHSYVSDVFFMEEAMAGPQSTTTHSILGPDVHVSCGEIHASILGPNTNAHHQSLLIATLWLGGRGNVAYGSNVGSNHTGRIPDQECCAGEGIFWGLSCIVKFPIDLTCAPYTIIAAGTTLMPQRCTMPFSLIINNTERKSGGTDIIPGWVLHYSPYTIVRSEQKFAHRRKAKRHLGYTGWSIIRPDILHLCYMARQQLLTDVASVSQDDQTVYTDRTISGIGANQLTEKGRLIGVQAYSELIQRFSLRGLYAFLVGACEICDASKVLLRDIIHRDLLVEDETNASDTNVSTSATWPTFPWNTINDSSSWKSQRYYLLIEFPISSTETIQDWMTDLLKKLLILEIAYTDRVCLCKKRDDIRGAATIPGYEETHTLVKEDAVVLSVQSEMIQRKTDIETLLQRLPNYL